MDDVTVGRLIRAIRIHRGWRQADVAARAGSSQAQVSRIERGQLDRLRLDEVRQVAAVLGVRIHISATWRGGDADRIVNEGHVALQAQVAERLAHARGWQGEAEVTFASAGERGAIDLLAWHPASRTILVVEVKTELADPGLLLAQVDRYRRLAPSIARERGWAAERVGVWVVIGESTMNRRRLDRTGRLLRDGFPARGPELHAWLRRPEGPIRALSFARCIPPGPTPRRTVAVRRVSRPSGRRNCTLHSPGASSGPERIGEVAQ